MACVQLVIKLKTEGATYPRATHPLGNESPGSPGRGFSYVRRIAANIAGTPTRKPQLAIATAMGDKNGARLCRGETEGAAEGSPIEDYVVEDHADHVLQTFKTQYEAIEWAKKTGHTPHVARVRHLNDKEKPDHWRAA